MKIIPLIILVIVAVILAALATTIVRPILIVAEDTGEDASIDMAAKFSIIGYDWVYPGSSVNAQGQTLHNVHIDNPKDPYGAARDIMTYSYNYTPHIIASVNNDAAEAIFGTTIVDDIRANDAYNGYAGNENGPGTMDRGDAVDTAMSKNGMNIFQVPIQILMGNIRFIFV